jgi:hypothetical protein
MHILLIAIILMLLFPSFARLVGSVLSAMLWLIGAIVVLAVIGALSH